MAHVVEMSTERYLRAVRSMRDRAADEYDRIYWSIELETRCSLTSSELHRRTMRCLRKKR